MGSCRVGIRWALLGLFAAIAIAAPAGMPLGGSSTIAAEQVKAPATPTLDVSYIPQDAVAALVLHPRQALLTPQFEMLPVEVIAAQLMELAAIDLLQVEEVIAIVRATTLQAQPSVGVIIRFAQAYDRQAVLARLTPDADTVMEGDSQLHRSPNGVTVFLPNDRTLVAGAEADVRAMVLAKDISSPLVERLRKLDASKPASAIVTFEPLRAEILATIGQLPPLPPPLHQFSDAPKHLAAIQVQIGIGPDAMLRLELEGIDEPAATALAGMLEDAIKLGYQIIDAQLDAMKQREAPAVEVAGMRYSRRVLELVLKQISRRQEGNRLVIDVKGEAAIATASSGALVALLLPAVQAARVAAQRSQSSNNLRQIGIAFHNYHDTYQRFPVSTYDKDGKPLLSWRVHILPYVEGQALYSQFHLDEPWNSPHNLKLVEQMPAVYQSPSLAADNRAGKTIYLAPTGEAALFHGTKKLSFRDITDGTSNTIMAVEATREKAVIWTKPDDLKIDPLNPLAGLANARPNGFSILLCDGSVRFVANTVDPEIMRRLFDPRDGKPVRLE